MKILERITSGPKRFMNGMNERALMVYATSGCYYLFMSLVPFVMILCCLLPFTPFQKELLLETIDGYFSESLGNIVRSIVAAIYASSGTTLTVSILLTLYSASASMRALMKGMNAAYGVKERDNFIRFNLRSLLYIMLLLVAILLSLIVMVYGGKILTLVKHYLPEFRGLDQILSSMRFVLVMALLAVFFLLLYSWMPNRKMRMVEQIPGAIFSAVVWVLFSAGFSWYVNISNKYGAYGYIGTIMVVMMWMYYCFFFLLIGGYINSLLILRKEEKRAKRFPQQAEEQKN